MNMDQRILEKNIRIPATVDSIWNDWTTKEGLESFFAPQAEIEFEPGGKFELYFLLDAEEGSRGSEGCKIIHFIKNEVFVFTWNNPPHLNEIRHKHTKVKLEFFSVDENTTHLRLTHQGWAEGDQWDAAYAYFDNAWSKVLNWNLEKYKSNTE